jgi:Protein of unknown function (DUF2510)
MTLAVTQVPAGWYPDPEDPKSLRYWDGQKYTMQRIRTPSEQAGAAATVILSGLALGFGAIAGGLALFSIPVLLFPLPLGFGTAGVALCLAALTTKGPKPWYLAIAAIAAIGGIVVGVSGYNDFSEASRSLVGLRASFGP